MFQRVLSYPAALLLIAGTAGCAAEIKSPTSEVAPEVRFEALQFEVFRGPVLEASGDATVASMRRDTSAILAESVQVDFPARDSREPARLTAASGTGNASDRWFEARGGVRVVQGDDEVVTDRARWSSADRLVRGDAPVRVSGPDYVLEGPGFTLDPDQRTVRIEGGAALRAGGIAR
jgi:hypothetical protein